MSGTPSIAIADGIDPPRTSSIVAYTAPMALFLVLTTVESWLPRHWYPAVYGSKIALVTVSLLLFREPLLDIRPSRTVVIPAAVTGILVFVCWVLIEKVVPYPRFDHRMGFNPFEAISGAWAQYAFIAVRLFGLALVVPVMEELFWRSFLLRYLTQSDFRSLPFNGFSGTAFATVAGLFALAHPEWLPAVLTACIYAGLLRQTRSIFAVVVAHATTNAALGAYILIARDWAFW